MPTPYQQAVLAAIYERDPTTFIYDKLCAGCEQMAIFVGWKGHDVDYLCLDCRIDKT